MKRDDSVYVGHMLDAGCKAQALLGLKDRAAYDADEALRLALTHLVQVIGEAARRVSQEFREKHSQIPWSQIVGMRHKIVHDYTEVEEDILWRVVTDDLPDLIGHLEPLTPPAESE